MEKALDHSPGYYWEVAGDGLLLAVNETLCTDLGYSKEELAGKHLEFISTIATRIFCQTHLFPLLQLKGHAEEIFITLSARDKQVLSILCNVKRRTDSEGAITDFAGIGVENRRRFEDELIEAKKTAEAALSENSALIHAKKELERSVAQLDINLNLIRQQNQELKQFNHVVTHVLREPVRKIILFSGMLTESKGPSEKKAETMEKLLRATHQIGSAVEGLQQYAWITASPGEIVPTDINEKLLLVKAQLEKEHPDVMIHLVSKPLPAVPADPAQLELLFYHILSNAVLFRKPDSPAVIHVDGIILQQNQFSLTPGRYKYADYLKIEIRDEGIGFDPAFKDQIFELFRKMQHSVSNGIGLALCKKIAEGHHGKIMADSVPGEGTVITVLLPAQKKEG